MLRMIRWRSALAGITMVGALALTTAVPAEAHTAVSHSHDSGEYSGKPHAASQIQPAVTTAVAQGDTPPLTNKLTKPECPVVLMSKCHVALAAYTQNDPSDPSNYGNLDLANRPYGGLTPQKGVELGINGVVIHDTEGSLASTLEVFRTSTTFVSATYVIDANGDIYQTTALKNIAFHAGNWYVNLHTVGIEHVGVAVNGAKDYTKEMYESSTLLVKYLSQRFHFPLDRAHVLGHDNVPAPTADLTAGQHWDPGPFWNWQREFKMMGVKQARPQFGGQLVTITRPFIREPDSTVTDSSSGTKVTLPSQAANFVRLHTSPSFSSPLLSDPALHPDGAPGTTDIADWGTTASYGQTFALAGRSCNWTGIWYAGQVGWFYNPAQLVNAVPTRGKFITPRAGLTSIPVYGRPYPEAGAYGGTLVPVQAVVPIQYRIPAGQRYSTTGAVPTDYYYTWYINNDYNRSDHTVVEGKTVYLQIQFNHRIGYVMKRDVTLVS